MPIDFNHQSVSVNFDPTQNQIQTQLTTTLFSSPVRRAEVALKGFDIQFTNSDHHLLREMIQASIDAIENNTVRVRVDYLLRDDSGNIDDPYQGTVNLLVIAEVA